MATPSPSPAVALPIYAVVALAGMATEMVAKLLGSLQVGARSGGRAVASVAAVPALAAAGLIWEVKDALHPSQDKTAPHSMLLAQPSIVNWHDMPVA